MTTKNKTNETETRIGFRAKDKIIRARWDREIADALKNGKSYSSFKEIHEEIVAGLK